MDQRTDLLSLLEAVNANDLIICLLLKLKLKVSPKRRRLWVHDVLKHRKEYGAFYHLVRHLELDSDNYFEYFRMSPAQMEVVLRLVGPMISKISAVREALESKQRLAITIRFLATGETYRSLASQYRVGVSTLSAIIPEVCNAIWVSMREKFMPFPKTSDEWQEKALRFFEKWGYPHCLGAMDGKHVIHVITAPDNSGSLYCRSNSKHSFSIVLLALVDADYKFTYIDVGAYGKQSDGGIFAASSLGKAVSNPNSLLLPRDDVIIGAEDLGPMPYVIVADEAFPLQKHIMRPYPRKNATKEENAYNYHHCRAQRIVKNAFGILSQRWRVYHTKLAVKPETVVKIVKATTVLHNMIKRQDNTGVQGHDDDSVEEVIALQPLHRIGNRSANEAVRIREKFSLYFNTHPLPLQESFIQRGLNT